MISVAASRARPERTMVHESRAREFGLELFRMVRVFFQPARRSSMLLIGWEGVDLAAKCYGRRIGLKAIKKVPGISKRVRTVFAQSIAPKIAVHGLPQCAVNAGAPDHASELAINLTSARHARWILNKWPRLQVKFRHIDLLVKKVIVA